MSVTHLAVSELVFLSNHAWAGYASTLKMSWVTLKT
jgi:hypothetical protein